MTQPTPTFAEMKAPHAIADVLHIDSIDSAVYASNGGMQFLIAITEEPLDSVDVKEPDVAQLLEGSGAVVLAIANIVSSDLVCVRAFLPGDAVFEDPGTGSLAGPLGVLAHTKYGAQRKLTVLQGDFVGRPCRIEVDADPNAVQVGGNCALFAEGEFIV